MWFIKIYIVHRRIYAGENSVTWVIIYADPRQFESNVYLSFKIKLKISWFAPSTTKVYIPNYSSETT